MDFSYETIGSSSYLVAIFEKGAGIINYQLQMISNNDIKNIIKANKRQKNDDVVISYNITSKITLSQACSKTKIPKLGLIKIIEGALATLADIEEYQLVSSGLVFNEDYVFVKPGNYEPSFIYLPNSMEDSGMDSLKNFIISLIMGSKVEISNDNFVQVLLEAFNNPALTAKELKKLCSGYKSDKSKAEIRKPDSGQGASSGSGQSVQPPVQPPVQQSVQQPIQPPVQPPVPPIGSQPPVRRQPPVIPIGPDDKSGKKKSGKKQKNKAEDTENSQNKSDNGSASTKFIILQVILIAVLAGLVFSGILSDEDGNLNMKYLAGVALGIIAVDFVAYREMFINSKEGKKTGKKAEKAPKQGVKKSSVDMPGREIPGRPSIPGREVQKPVGAHLPPVKPPVQPPVQQPVQQPVQSPIQPPVQTQIPSPAYVTPEQQPGMVSDFDSEDTVVLDGGTQGAYLEYFENGLATKIKIVKDSTIIGKLRGQCDFVINNNKVSRVHAEFIRRGSDYFVKDYNSMNGTYINGSTQRITTNVEYQIFNGDRITLADVDLTFIC